MTNDEVLAVINQAAKMLLGAIALILVTEFAVEIADDGAIELIYDGELVEEEIANEIKAAVKDALESLGHNPLNTQNH